MVGGTEKSPILFSRPWGQGEPNSYFGDEDCMQLGDYNDTVGVNDAVCESTGTAVLCKCDMQNVLNAGDVVTTSPEPEKEKERTTTEATTTIIPNGKCSISWFRLHDVISSYAISTYAFSTVAISIAHNFNLSHFQPSGISTYSYFG